MAGIVDKRKKGGNGGAGGTGTGMGYRKDQLTRIFLFAAWLVACVVGKARMSDFAAVVVLATHGDVQGT